MAALVEFSRVKEELDGAKFMYTMQTLSRKGKWTGMDQKPAVLIVTDKCIYHGGTASTSDKFSKITKEDIISVKRTGFLIWTAIEVKYTYEGNEKNVYLCPFKGRAERPRIDQERLRDLEAMMECL